MAIKELISPILPAAVLLIAVNANGAFDNPAGDARSLGMDGAEAFFPEGYAQLQGNPASSGGASVPSLSTSYSRLYGLGELPLAILAYSHPLASGAARIALQTFGDDVYHENSGAVALARLVSKNLWLGVGLRGMHLSISEMGTTQAWGVDLGLAGRPSPDLAISFYARNLNHPRLGRLGDQVPSAACLGLTFRPIRRAALVCDLFRDTRFPTEMRVGQEYWLCESLALRFGFSTEPSTYSFGSGVSGSRFRLDYGFRYHPTLGATHQVSLSLFPGEPRAQISRKTPPRPRPRRQPGIPSARRPSQNPRRQWRKR